MRLAAILLLSLTLLGCTTEINEEVSATPIGDFRLDQLIVNADHAMRGGLSRKAEAEQMEVALARSLKTRFNRFQGEGTYGMIVTVAGYVLAAPGIPVLVAPKSVLGIEAELFTVVDGKFVPINEKPKRLVIFEDAGGDTFIGSGFTQSGEEQLAELSDNAAIEIEKWMRENPTWFGLPPLPVTPEVTADE